MGLKIIAKLLKNVPVLVSVSLGNDGKKFCPSWVMVSTVLMLHPYLSRNRDGTDYKLKKTTFSQTKELMLGKPITKIQMKPFFYIWMLSKKDYEEGKKYSNLCN